MGYCSVDDLIDTVSERVLIQLTDDSTPPKEININRCLAAIEESSEIIDGRLRSRYSSLPLVAPVPALIRSICIDIATYKLYSRRNQGNIENVRARYRDALENLDKIRLNEQTPSVGGAVASYRVNRRRSDRIFTDEFLARL